MTDWTTPTGKLRVEEQGLYIDGEYLADKNTGEDSA